MNTMKDKLPKVADCIAYIEKCGWKLTNQYRGCVYYFYNENQPDCFKQMRFTLTELRHALKYGW